MGKSCLDLADRVAVVFGGTSGLGKNIAIGLAEHGADVIPGGRRVELLEASPGALVLVREADAADPAKIERILDAARARGSFVALTSAYPILLAIRRVTPSPPEARPNRESARSEG